MSHTKFKQFSFKVVNPPLIFEPQVGPPATCGEVAGPCSELANGPPTDGRSTGGPIALVDLVLGPASQNMINCLKLNCLNLICDTYWQREELRWDIRHFRVGHQT